MSVNIALIPVAMAIKATMGEENFRKWVESNQFRLTTKFEDKQELIQTIEKSGYDAQDWGSALKTHLKNDFFFWEFKNGKWDAIFSIDDSKEMIKEFMDDIELKSGIKIFLEDPKIKRKSPIQNFSYPTDFKDEELLIKTLTEYGANPTVDSKGQIKINLADNEFIFSKIEDGTYNAEIKSRGDLKDIYNQLSLIDGDYKSNVQSRTYETLKRKIEEELEDRFRITDDRIEDDVVVVTLDIRN